jgi:hypothetical protein
VTGTGLRRFGIFAILDPTLVPQGPAFLRLLLARRRLAVLVGLFLYESSGFFDFAFDTHFALLFAAYAVLKTWRA